MTKQLHLKIHEARLIAKLNTRYYQELGRRYRERNQIEAATRLETVSASWALHEVEWDRMWNIIYAVELPHPSHDEYVALAALKPEELESEFPEDKSLVKKLMREICRLEGLEQSDES